MSLRAYANKKGVSAPTISARIEAGILSECVIRDGNKLYIDSEIADREWEENKDDLREEGQRAAEALGLASEKKAKLSDAMALVGDIEREDEEEAEEDKALSGLRASRQQKEFYEAKLRQLKFEREDGTLIEVAVVRDRIGELTRRTKEALLNLPEQIGPQLLSYNDLTELQNFLRQAINDALAKLSMEGTDAGQS